jgi:chromosome segregation ATPase
MPLFPQRPQVPQRHAVVPGMHLLSRGNNNNNSNPNSARSSSRNVSPNRNLANVNSNTQDSRRNSNSNFTVDDKQKREAEFNRLRNKRLNIVMPTVRQRENELMLIFNKTSEIIQATHDKYLNEEEQSVEELHNERVKYRALHASLNEKREQIDQLKKTLAEASAQLAEQHEKHRAAKKEVEALGAQVAELEKEIGVVIQKKEQSVFRMQQILDEQNKRRLSLESLKNDCEQALGEEKIAENILNEKKAGLKDLEQKIAFLRRQQKSRTSGNNNNTSLVSNDSASQ